MNIFVTGGSGFIGREVIAQLLSTTDNQIINIDCLSYAGDFYKSLASSLDDEHKERYVFERVNLCYVNSLELLFNKHKPSFLIHLAAESHVDQSIESPSNFIQSNIIGTFNLLECVRKYLLKFPALTENFKFLHVSTDEVFGDLSIDDNAFTEASPIRPSSPYSASKASSDLLVDAWVRTHNLPCMISHCSNNYGQYQHPEKLIPFMIKKAISHEVLTIYGDGENIRDWLHVSDHASALIDILFKGQVGRHYNVGGSNEQTNNNIVKLICEELTSIDEKKERPKFDYSKLIKYIIDRKGHDIRYAINSSRIHDELGWSAKIGFEEGFRQTVRWYYSYFSSLKETNGK